MTQHRTHRRRITDGLIGAVVVSLLEQAERQLLGRLPVYAAAELVRYARVAWRRSEADWLVGLSARGLYCIALSSLVPRRTLPFSIAPVAAAELLFLPALGLAPPLRRWRALEFLLLPLHVSSFFLALSAMRGRGRARSLQRSSKQEATMPEPQKPIDEPKKQKAATTQYTCPMHPEVVQSAPGRCPKCNMALEAKKPGGG